MRFHTRAAERERSLRTHSLVLACPLVSLVFASLMCILFQFYSSYSWDSSRLKIHHVGYLPVAHGAMAPMLASPIYTSHVSLRAQNQGAT